MNTPTTKNIPLDTPLQRGEQQITAVDIRKPASGELRGLNLTDLLQMDVNALTKLLPRITSPVLTEADVAKLDPADLVEIGGTVALFLVKKAQQAPVSPGV